MKIVEIDRSKTLSQQPNTGHNRWHPDIPAIVEADPGELVVEDLLAFLAERLVRYKIPRTVEIVREPLRDDAGKVRRGALRAERMAATAR